MHACGRVLSRYWIWLSSLALSSWTASSRHLIDTIKIGYSPHKKRKTYDHKGWHHIAKFAFGPAGGHASIRLRLSRVWPDSESIKNQNQTYHMDFHAYSPSKWRNASKVIYKTQHDEYLQAGIMCRKSQEIEPHHMLVGFPMNTSIDDPPDNWGAWVDLKFKPGLQNRMWYFTLSHCARHMPKAELEFEMKLRQADNSEFSVEREFSLPAHCASIVILLLLIMYWLCRLRSQEASCEDCRALHPLTYVMTLIMICQLLGHFCHLYHLAQFGFNGIGNEYVDIVAESFMMLAQVIQVFLLIMLARGHAIADTEEPDGTMVGCASMIVFMIHIVALVFSHLSGTEHAHRFHGHEGLYGYLVVTMRLLLLVWFLCAVRGTKSRNGPDVKAFLNKLQAAGCLYFLTYPVMRGVIIFVPPYVQHRFMQIGLLSMHFLMNVILVQLFLAGGSHFRLKGGWYRKGSIWDDDDDEERAHLPEAGEVDTRPRMTEEERAAWQASVFDMLDMDVDALMPQSTSDRGDYSAPSAPEPMSIGRDSV